jgi:hypothetical protein
MGSFDFSNAELPRLLPLENSYAENGVEADLKQLFLKCSPVYMFIITSNIRIKIDI